MKNTLVLAFFLLISLLLFRPLHADIDPNACKGSCPGTDLCCTNNTGLSCQTEETCKTPKGLNTGVCLKKCPDASGGCTQDSECNGTNKCYQGECVICTANSDCQAAGTVCVNNQCIDDPNTCTPGCAPNYLCINNGCVAQKECSQESDCPVKGLHCIGNQCLHCSDQYPCAAGLLCQAGQCVDDPNSCDPSGCKAGESCQGGQCVATNPNTPGNTSTFCDMGQNTCPGGKVCQDWKCINPKSSPKPGGLGNLKDLLGKEIKMAPKQDSRYESSDRDKLILQDLRVYRERDNGRGDQPCDPELEVTIGKTPLSYNNRDVPWLKITYQAPCASLAHLWGPFILFDAQKNILIKTQKENIDPEKSGTKWQADQKVPSQQCSPKANNCYGYKTAQPDAFGYDLSQAYQSLDPTKNHNPANLLTKDQILANWRVEATADEGEKNSSQEKTVYALFAPFSPESSAPNNPGLTPRIRLALLQKDGWKLIEKAVIPPPPSIACQVTLDPAIQGYQIRLASQNASAHYLTLQTMKNIATYVDLPVNTWCTKALDPSNIVGTHWEETYQCPYLLLQEAQTIGCGSVGFNQEDIANIKRELKLTKPKLDLEFYKAAIPSSDGTCTQFKDGNIDQSSTNNKDTILNACTEVALKYGIKRNLQVNNLGVWGDETKITLGGNQVQFTSPFFNIPNADIVLPYLQQVRINTGRRHCLTGNCSEYPETILSGGSFPIPFEQIKAASPTSPGFAKVPRNYQSYRYQIRAWGFSLSGLQDSTPQQLQEKLGKSITAMSPPPTDSALYESPILMMDYPFSFKVEEPIPAPVIGCTTYEGKATCNCVGDWMCDIGGWCHWSHKTFTELQKPTYQLNSTSQHAKEIKVFCYNSKGSSEPPMPLSAYKTKQLVTFNGIGADGNRKCTLQVTYQDGTTTSDCLVLPNVTYSDSCSGTLPSEYLPPTCP